MRHYIENPAFEIHNFELGGFSEKSVALSIYVYQKICHWAFQI